MTRPADGLAAPDRPAAFDIIARHFDPGTLGHRVLVIHSVLVARKALDLARRYAEREPEVPVDLDLLEEIGLLHDIGISRVDAPEIGCHGDAPYIRHGVLGREILEAEGLPVHALACERHTGAGITREEVAAQALPLPGDRDFLPVSVEERLLCVADKFYGKSPGKLWLEKPLEKVESGLARYGEAVEGRWRELWRAFGS